MMAGQGNWTPDEMRSYMQQVLGAQGYQEMVDHTREVLKGADDGSGRGGMMGEADDGTARAAPGAG